MRFFKNERSDFAQVYVPSRAWINGLNPYNPNNFVEVYRDTVGGSPDVNGYWTHSAYPLTTQVVLSPIAALPWLAAEIMWVVLLALPICLAMWALASLACLPQIGNTYLFMALTLALAPLQTGVAVGNLGILAVCLCAMGAWAADRRKYILAGVLLAIAACLKPQVAIWFILYHSLRKRWQLVLVCAGVGIAVLSVGILRLEASGVTWLPDYLENAHRFVADTPPVDFTEADPIRFTMVNLQVLFYALVGSTRGARIGALAVSAILLAVWLWLGFRRNGAVPAHLTLSVLALLSLLPNYHRNYDAAVLMFPLSWMLSGHAGRTRTLSLWGLFLLIPFAFPGAAALQQLAQSRRFPPEIQSSWWWNTLIMPHQIWALLLVSILLLRAMAIWPGEPQPLSTLHLE